MEEGKKGEGIDKLEGWERNARGSWYDGR